MILATNDTEWMEDIKKQLESTFQMKDKAKISTCLRIKFNRDFENRVYLSQKVLERSGMSECKPVMTPIDVNVKLKKYEIIRSDIMEQYPYQSLIGAW